MRKSFLLLFLPFFLFGEAKVDLGIDCFFREELHKSLKGKKVGIITNQTGVNKDLKSTIELFLEHAQDYKVIALFAPEHGLDGKGYAADKVQDTKYKSIPVYSLHGETRRPTKEMLKNIDLLIYDIQDIGSRTYTYSTTLYYVMEEASKYQIPVIVLDRPNPINGLIVDGPMLEDGFRSFIGYINVPYCHGMTIGELALFFNAEYKVKCDLTVVPMKGWKREMSFQDTGLHWIPTSPNIPESDTPFFYATTGILGELDLLNIGIGYTLPFKIVGAPWIDAEVLAERLNGKKIAGAHFIPFHYRPFYGSFKGKECHGVKIIIIDTKVYEPLKTQYVLFSTLKALYPKIIQSKLLEATKPKKDLFNKANGTAHIYHIFASEKDNPLRLISEQDAHKTIFLEKRKKYLLYP